MIGGGLGSYIGKFHRWGAMLDDSAELVCGCPPVQTICSMPARRLSHVAAGHNKGFIEAFSNIYRSFCNVLSDRKAGRENTTDTFPTVKDGVLGVRFVEACVRSHTAGGVWMDV